MNSPNACRNPAAELGLKWGLPGLSLPSPAAPPLKLEEEEAPLAEKTRHGDVVRSPGEASRASGVWRGPGPSPSQLGLGASCQGLAGREECTGQHYRAGPLEEEALGEAQVAAEKRKTLRSSL